MFRRFAFAACCTVFSHAMQLQAQSITIQGRVTDAATSRPIAQAAVRVYNTTTGAGTNDSGRYTFSYRPAARDTAIELQVVGLGFTAERRVVKLGQRTITADFALRAAPQSVTVAQQDAAAGSVSSGPARAGGSGAAGGRAAGGVARGGGGSGGGRGGAGRGAAAPPAGVASAYRTAAQMPPCTDPQQCRPNTESYDRIVDNPFLAVDNNALSTFSIDVDRASYSIVRRMINTSQRPQKDAVRIEEMLNYFAYDYPAPTGPHPFSVSTEVGNSPWNRQHRLVRIGLQGKKIETASLPPNNLVFLIDVSGSMSPANKLPLVKSSLRLLVEQLREQDRVAMVVYAGRAGLVLAPTSGADKTSILDAIERLEAGGSTAGGAGLRLAYAVARQFHLTNGNNRVIIASDGDFNVGVSSDAEMERLIEEERAGGTFLTVLGFGMGNLKDSKLERLADKGNGNYAYIDDVLEARKTLVQEMGGTLHTIAKDVKLQVEFNPARVQAYRLIGYENRVLRAEDFNNDQKDAGELGAGHSVTALYEIIPTGVRSNVPIRGIDSLRYRSTATQTSAASSNELLFVKLRYKQPTADSSTLLTHTVMDRTAQPSADFTFAAAVAAFGMILRDSEYKGTATTEDVISMARRSTGADPFGYRGEFVRLVERYEKLPPLPGRMP